MHLQIKFKSLLLLALSSCAITPQEKPTPPLAHAILQPWPGKAGKLVTSRCTYPDGKSCQHDLKEFDLSDKPTRMELRELGFVCDVNGDLYRIAQETPSLIFEGYKKAWVFGKLKLELQKLINVKERYQFLIESRTLCYSFKNFGLKPLRE